MPHSWQVCCNTHDCSGLVRADFYQVSGRRLLVEGVACGVCRVVLEFTVRGHVVQHGAEDVDGQTIEKSQLGGCKTPLRATHSQDHQNIAGRGRKRVGVDAGRKRRRIDYHHIERLTQLIDEVLQLRGSEQLGIDAVALTAAYQGQVSVRRGFHELGFMEFTQKVLLEPTFALEAEDPVQ